MVNKKILVFAALALGQFFALNVSAQNLFINDIDVKYNSTTGGYCNDISSGTDDLSYSFVPGASSDVWHNSSLIEFERPRFGNPSYPGNCLGLCVQLACVSTTSVFGIDELTFEIFKFGPGANPLDPASTPPIKTISMFDIGMCNSAGGLKYYVNRTEASNSVWRYCAAWDGSYNLNGMFGKTNGQFGFRAHVKTNRVSDTAGNISIEQTAAFPGQNQIPIQVNVTNIHTVRSSPTVVGKITGVAAQPYNILYRLSKDATVTISVYDADAAHLQYLPPPTTPYMPLVRTIISSAPRSGEGTPDGTLTNGDFWDGRDSRGNIVPAGNFLAYIEANTNDTWQPPTDEAWPQTIQLGLDPLQITDVAVKPLGASSTDLAVISYLLTEAATVYVRIYTPETSFSDTNVSPPSTSTGRLLREFVEQKDRRVTATTFWDGRDDIGNPVCDGDYVYALYAVLPSSANYVSGGQIWTRNTKVGTVPVARGHVLAFMSNSSTVVGSSPTAADLDPFYFRYTPTRDTLVTLNILDTGSTTVRTVVSNVTRTNISNREIWDGRTDTGAYVSPGLYQAELITTDPFQCAANRVSTVTARFSVDMFRIVDVKASPLLGGSSDTAKIGFEFSQSLFMELNVYDTNVVIDPSKWPWRSPAPGAPVYSATGMRPGRFNITEYWDGRDIDGQLLPDGSYPFTLVAHTTGTAQTVYALDKVYGAINIARGQIIFSLFEIIPNIPTMYSSSDTVKLPPYEVDYVVTRQSSVTVTVIDYSQSRQGRVVATVTDGQTRDGDTLYKDFWDGKTDLGSFVPGGQYDVRVTAQDISRNLTGCATVQQTIDVYPLRIYDVSIMPLTLDQPAVILYQISEPMKVVTKVFYPGTYFDDGSGKAHPLEPGSVVKRIIGVRPARTQISEYWDGTDLTLSKVPDGNYPFKLYASTDTLAISTLDGSYGDMAMPEELIVTANIPLTRGGTADLCGDFSRDSFFAPNPYEGTAGWFKIPVIVNGRITLKIYNLAGDLVYKYDFGVLGAGEDITHPWAKVNSSGRMVAGGVYFAVIRFEASEGTRDVCQVVKKILIP